MTSVKVILSNVFTVLSTLNLSNWSDSLPNLIFQLEKFKKFDDESLHDLLCVNTADTEDNTIHEIIQVTSDSWKESLLKWFAEDVNLLCLLLQVADRVSSCYHFFYDAEVARLRLATYGAEIKATIQMQNALDSLITTINAHNVDPTCTVTFKHTLINNSFHYLNSEISRTDFRDSVLFSPNYSWFNHGKRFNLFLGFNKFIGE
nr:p23 [Allamanda chlorotic virus A]